MIGIRGATTAENTEAAIHAATRELLQEMIDANGIEHSQIIDIIFSATKDLDMAYPAAAARQMGFINAGLFCVQEMYVKNSLTNCIRVLLHAEIADRQQADVNHIYLHDAVVLRPDLNKEKTFAIAIDGPVGSGKSTVAKAIAQKLGIIYIDTGAMYRAVALYNVQQGIDLTDEERVVANLPNISIKIRYVDAAQRIFLNDIDVTDQLRTSQITEGSSIVASYSEVRQKLVSMQRLLSAKENVIMDGRDIGTVVLPNADLKIYLDASVDNRAKRRFDESKDEATLAEIKTAITERDERDKNRKHSPLLQAEDAVYIVSDNMTVEEVRDMIIKLKTAK
ncbi:MAG: (d)CMP kinase [Turicibacter sp.]|nr:(d)CMP kinase [Turicibacter sp.]